MTTPATYQAPVEGLSGIPYLRELARRLRIHAALAGQMNVTAEKEIKFGAECLEIWADEKERDLEADVERDMEGGR